jgi:hypothetical protein
VGGSALRIQPQRQFSDFTALSASHIYERS